MPIIEAVRWSPDGAVRIVDQRRLPAELVERDLRTVEEVCDALRSLAQDVCVKTGSASSGGSAAISCARSGAAATGAT